MHFVCSSRHVLWSLLFWLKSPYPCFLSSITNPSNILIAISQTSSMLHANGPEVCTLWWAFWSSNYYSEAPEFHPCFCLELSWAEVLKIQSTWNSMSFPLVISGGSTSSVSWTVFGIGSLESPSCLLLTEASLSLLYSCRAPENFPSSLPSLLQSFMSVSAANLGESLCSPFLRSSCTC